MNNEYITVSNLIDILTKIENPTETYIGMPRKNGYGEIYFAPTKNISVNTKDWYENILYNPNPTKLIFFE